MCILEHWSSGATDIWFWEIPLSANGPTSNNSVPERYEDSALEFFTQEKRIAKQWAIEMCGPIVTILLNDKRNKKYVTNLWTAGQNEINHLSAFKFQQIYNFFIVVIFVTFIFAVWLFVILYSVSRIVETK